VRTIPGHRIEPPPPVLDPRTVAATIVELADAPRASVSVGGAALPTRLAHAVAPELTSRMTMKMMDTALAHAGAAPVTDGNLFAPSVGTAIDGGYRARRGAMGWRAASVVAAGIGLALGWWKARGHGGPSASNA
jgi:hypothetical protein